MPTERQSAEDPRETDELFRVALTEFDLSDEEFWSASTPVSALVALQCRPTREVLDRACEQCRSVDVNERQIGVRVLAELRDVTAARPAFVEESMEMLLALAATEANTEVLAEVARAFGFRGDPRAVEPLLGWRGHPAQQVRLCVAFSLPRCGTRDNESQVVGALIELTDDHDGEVRDYALFGLRELEVGSAQVRDAMLRRVRDPDVSAAGEALVGLARLGDERAIAPLIEYIGDPDPQGAIAYGLDAATALADPRLLPTLRALEQRLGDRPDLRQAIMACTAGR